MYVVLVYDCGVKRVGKMLRLCRRYLTWIQNSVFEGEITQGKLAELLNEARLIMDLEVDSVIVFKSRKVKWMDKLVVGVERNALDDFL